MQRDKVYRRYQRERKINNVRKWMEAHWHYGFAHYEPEARRAHLHEQALRRHAAPKMCSRWCCGNPRKHFGSETIQEYRNKIACNEVFDEENIRSKIHIRKRRY